MQRETSEAEASHYSLGQSMNSADALEITKVNVNNVYFMYAIAGYYIFSKNIYVLVDSSILGVQPTGS